MNVKNTTKQCDFGCLCFCSISPLTTNIFISIFAYAFINHIQNLKYVFTYWVYYILYIISIYFHCSSLKRLLTKIILPFSFTVVSFQQSTEKKHYCDKSLSILICSYKNNILHKTYYFAITLN